MLSGKLNEFTNSCGSESSPQVYQNNCKQVQFNKDGNLRNIDFDKKKPKRLYKTTEKIFKKYIFPKPPENILNNQKLVKFKISVNFILK